jgi:exopolyphosphatase/guanosine-5'-triphosphate,3'-diphosphate pyrophosphatase
MAHKQQPHSRAPHAGKFRGRAQSVRRWSSDTNAVIDIGSNSIKLRVVRRWKNVLRTLVDTTEVVRLGGLQDGRLGEETMKRGISVIRRLVRLAGEMGARPRLVGTMALRVARNAEDFVARVRERTGLTIEILSGAEEARLAWLGAIHGLDVGKGDVMVFDTGGGSTEFIFGLDGRIVQSVSLPVGAVRLTEKFFDADPVAPDSPARAGEYIREVFRAEGLNALRPSSSIPSIVGLGGGVAAMASVKLGLTAFSPSKINGMLLTRDDIAAQVELFTSLPLAERMKIPGLPVKRADIVLASACIVRCALEAMNADSFRASINGLRHGLVLEMFEGRG